MQALAIDPSVSEKLDLERRLRETPRAAMVRGLFFNMIADELRRQHHRAAARRILGPSRRIYGLYPVSDFLIASAQAAPFIRKDPIEAVRATWYGGSKYFAATWLGRAFRRFIRPDPASALQWLEAGREHFCNYGRWRCERTGPNRVVIHMFDEYIWIDSAHKGGCEGLLLACSVDGTVTADVDGLFSGRLIVEWSGMN